jgi:hypothetical protein
MIWEKLGEDPPDLPGNPQQAAVSDGGALSNLIPLLNKEKDIRAADFSTTLQTRSKSQASTAQNSTNAQGFYQYVLRAVRCSYVLVQAVQYQPQGGTR